MLDFFCFQKNTTRLTFEVKSLLNKNKKQIVVVVIVNNIKKKPKLYVK